MNAMDPPQRDDPEEALSQALAYRNQLKLNLFGEEGQEHGNNSWRRATAGAAVPSAGTGLGGAGLGSAGLGGPVLGGTGQGCTSRGCSGLETGGLDDTGRGSAGLGSAGLGSLGLGGLVLGGTVRGCTGRGNDSLETGGLGYDGMGSSDMADLGVDGMANQSFLDTVGFSANSFDGDSDDPFFGVGADMWYDDGSHNSELRVRGHGRGRGVSKPRRAASGGLSRAWPQLCPEAVAACHRLLVEVVGANVHVHLMVDMILVAVVRQRRRTSHHVQMYLSPMAMSILRLPVKMRSFRKPQISTLDVRIANN
ncbi:hypothetical protein PR202_gb14725 [Eleusine coracana subsp. coracana]|uniref:Uncharacterized protein n=1 Tax=Eleusine coracana subsp. coracana TaxID=191504 RepID=A0AAV5EWJ1_ELECO|nr:hypothetical protein PR202_gb14725 [Eleusine coracana subsp. coracana]